MSTNLMADIHNLLQAAAFFSRDMSKGTDYMISARHYIDMVSSCPDLADLIENQYRDNGREMALRTLINKAMELSR